MNFIALRLATILQSIRFRHKAILISIAFAIPTAVLSVSFINVKLTGIQITEKELLGLRYIYDIAPVARAVRALRRVSIAASVDPTVTTASLKARIELVEALAQLKKTDALYGDALRTHELVKELEVLQNQSAEPAAGLFKVFSSHSKVAKKLRELTSQVADESGLSLDSDIDTYYLQDAALLQLPVIWETESKMRSLSAAIASSGQPSAIATLELTQEEGLIEGGLELLVADLKKVIAVHPELKTKLDVTRAVKALADLRDLAGDDPSRLGPAGAKRINEAAAVVSSEFNALNANMLDALNSLLEQRRLSLRNDLILMVTIVAISLILASILFGAFVTVVGRGLQKVSEHLKTLAVGDLTKTLKVVGQDESAELTESLQVMQQSLVNLVTLINGSAENIASTSNQVSHGAQELTRRTQLTVSHLHSTAQAISEITHSIESAAANAQQATGLANENSKLATLGGKVIGDVAKVMDEIRESSNKIGAIISVIDGIAFQTNILALNAAVEAARAGEAGRGFAVVATEVRALAQRSAGAAREIKMLIAASEEKVRAGNTTVQSAGTTIGEIVLSAQHISHLLDDINLASREQALGIRQIEQTIQELSMTSGENAQMVDETSSSAGSLNQLAFALVTEVNAFKIPQQDTEFF